MAKILTKEPDWISGDLGACYTRYTKDSTAPRGTGPVQQSDLLKPLLMDIARNGLATAFEKQGELPPLKKRMFTAKKAAEVPPKVRHVVIVGAGMAGLVAAYELVRSGHKVSILEMQTRVGGRVKTFGEKDGFAKGLYVDAGAMRLPCTPEATEKTHFLVDYYAKDVFNLDMVPFKNKDSNAFYMFYNSGVIQQKDWKNEQFSELWPGWDEKVKENSKIKTIDDYYTYSTSVVTKQLYTLLDEAGNDEEKKAKAWKDWIDNWCQFSLSGFLLSSVEAIRTKMKDERFEDELDLLEEYLPWPDAAVRCYSVYSYTEQLDQSLVQYLRDEMGNWWSDNMHHIDGGMSLLPEKFAANTEYPIDITFNVTVNEINFKSTKDKLHDEVTVKGYYTSTGRSFEVKGNAVIVTTPVHILRQIKFVADTESNTQTLPNDYYKATEDIWYGPSTKIMLQCKTKFWEKQHGIHGGFSKTSLPVGQIHYPTAAVKLSEVDIVGERGILLVYTWKSEALLFGSLKPLVAINEAVRQIAEIHPEIEDQFEVGAIEAWYNEPSAQGAYALLKPNQFKNVRTLYSPHRNIYFAGEAISFATGWIQGAMESGLKAAYQFYSRNELNP